MHCLVAFFFKALFKTPLAHYPKRYKIKYEGVFYVENLNLPYLYLLLS